ncbi:phage terminase small subunit [Sphingomonas morindae]|uniref:Terminase n=1 Tax=Sphingomonas morindae TaxID=1541170 RepID=A0ABY4X724_9SPHN|nr:phage terminase small subunit [Sphingomonas morindae]USI72723.1 terminase [Sphingomonas morindae]
MSLARQTRERVLAAQSISAVDPAVEGGLAASVRPQADAAAATIATRLTHDLRRLKQIRSIERKIDAKREMLPDYAGWIEGLLAADAGVGTGVAADVLPTIMVWAIDTGDFAHGLRLAAFLLRHKVAMPARYQRDTATLVVEEIAEAALKAQAAGRGFPLDVLLTAEALTAALDMHDAPRAKLWKAIGFERMKAAARAAPDAVDPTLTLARDALRRARALDPRIGVTGKLNQLEKALAPPAPNRPAKAG